MNMENGKINLEFMEILPLNAFPFGYDDGSSIVFRSQLGSDVLEKYKSKLPGGSGWLEPGEIELMVTSAATYVLNEKYNAKYGQKGVIFHRAVRRIGDILAGYYGPYDYRFYLDVRNEFLKEKTPEEIRIDLGIIIENIINEYDDIIELRKDRDDLLFHFERLKTKAFFKLV